ncbi:hypothetical protein RB195_014600 [Necator americanus]|uniref:Uncharacterized protein n=1 Tax=Necator americanus TaxID=51031 RepID=A0ABR1E1B0_NECAM
MVLLMQSPDLLTMDGTYFYFLGLLDGGGESLFALHVIKKRCRKRLCCTKRRQQAIGGCSLTDVAPCQLHRMRIRVLIMRSYGTLVVYWYKESATVSTPATFGLAVRVHSCFNSYLDSADDIGNSWRNATAFQCCVKCNAHYTG